MDNAECILTDSYHATIFSVLFSKPIVVYQRNAIEKGNNMGSRIDYLMNLLKLEDLVDDIDNPHMTPQNCNKVITDSIICDERKKSIQFLKNSLGL